MAPNDLKDRVRAITQRSAGQTPARPGPVAPGEGRPAPAGQQAHVDGARPGAVDEMFTHLSGYETQFEAALPQHISTGAFLAATRAILPGLTGCTPASVLQALLTCARFGLLPDGHGAVIEAQDRIAVFIPTYRGYIDLMYRSGLVESVHVGLIHEGDEWSFEPTAPAPLDFTHKARPDLPAAERGPVILAYAFCWLKGGTRSQVALINREKAEQIRDEFSRAYQRAEASGQRDSFWHRRFDDQWRKTALRALFRLVPSSAEVRALEATDDAGEDGRVQILHAPDPETATLTAQAEQAHTAAEGSQEPAVTGPPRPKRRQPKRTSRAGRRRGGQARGRGRR